MEKKSEMGRFGLQVNAFMQRAVRELIRDRAALFFNFVWPLFWYFLIVYLMVAPGVDAETLPFAKTPIAVGIGIFATMQVCLMYFSGAFLVDLEKGRYNKFRTLPIHSLADFLGRFIGASIIAMISFAVVMSVAAIDRAYLSPQGLVVIPTILISLFLLCLFATGIGGLTAMFSKKPQTGSTMGLVILMILFFITGFNGVQPKMFPAEPEGLNVLPNSLAARITIASLTDKGLEGLTPPALPTFSSHFPLLLAFAIGFVSISGFLFWRVYGKG